MVRYLKYADIDLTRWNAAVNNDPTHLPYALSWWLDAVCPGRWDGLVFDEYRVVMPLPREPFSLRRPFRSWARPQVQRPFFTQQCGPFGDVRPGDVTALFANLPAELYSFALPLSEHSLPADIPEKYTVDSRTNYILDLSPELESIRAGYHKDLRRKLRKSGPATLLNASPELVITTYRNNVGDKAGLKPKHFTRARALIKAALRHDSGSCYQLQSEDGQLLATGFFPHHKGRIINLVPASTPIGYRQEGMTRLIDEVIKKHRGPGRLLDFEGSDIPGIARFFRYFGPENRPYLSVK